MTKFGDDLIASMTEGLAHAKGEPVDVRVTKVKVDRPDVRALRSSLGLSRAAFAERYGLDARAVQDWEQGRRMPDRAARILLRVIRRAPDLVAEEAHADAAS